MTLKPKYVHLKKVLLMLRHRLTSPRNGRRMRLTRDSLRMSFTRETKGKCGLITDYFASTKSNKPISVDSCRDNKIPKKQSLKRAIDPPQADDTPHLPSKRRPNISQLSTTIRSEAVKKMAENIDSMIKNLNATKTNEPPYNVKDVIIPNDQLADCLFQIVTEVFCNSKNCDYFNGEEHSQVFKLVALSGKARQFLVEIYRKRNKWSDSCSDSELKKESLEKTGLFDFDIEAESLENLMKQLSEQKLKDLCRQFKSPTVGQCKKLKRESETTHCAATKKAKSVRDIMTEKLLKTVASQRGIFARSSPCEQLKINVLKALGQPTRLKEDVISLLDRILTLFTPFEEISVPVEDIFDKLTKISEGTRCYPKTPIESYPLFQDRGHLLRYVEWKNKLKLVKMLVTAKDLEGLKNIGNQAYSQLQSLLEETSTRQEELMYSDRYMCLELVTTAIEGFKTHPSLASEAVEMLKYLAEQESYPPSKRGDWYRELAYIQSKSTKKVEVKNLEPAAAATIKGLNLANLSEGTLYALIKIAENLSKKPAFKNSDNRLVLENLIKEKPKQPSFEPANHVGAYQMKGNSTGQKSRWYIVLENGPKIYGTVENIAEYHYGRQGYVQSWHCENSLPITLFTLLMWDEIYSVPVPMAYLSAYQKAPLDLYTSEFFNNRKVQIVKRLEEIEALSGEKLGTLVVNSFEERKKYESVMPNKLEISNEKLKDVVRCLGAKVVAGICRRMAENFPFWKAGFPDLVVWNSEKNYCKIVEVKGPGTVLTDKQTLWLAYLKNLGADAELCQVKDLTHCQTLLNCNENNTE